MVMGTIGSLAIRTCPGSDQMPRTRGSEGEDNAIEVEEQLANGRHVLRGERRLIDLPM
jgi:hypothetical protein